MRLLRLLGVLLPLLLLALIVDASLMEATGGRRLLDPYLILTVWFGAHGRKTDGMLVGAVAGLVQDLRVGLVVGVQYLAKVIVGYAAMLASGRLIQGQPTTHAVLLSGATVLGVIVVTLLGTLIGRIHDTGSATWLLAEVACNVAVGVAAYQAVERWRRHRERGRGRGARGR